MQVCRCFFRRGRICLLYTSDAADEPVRRKARARRARSSLVREPMRMEEDAFWSLPQARLEYGPEVLTTPVMNTTKIV